LKLPRPVPSLMKARSVKLGKPGEPLYRLSRLPGGKAGSVIMAGLILVGLGALLGWAASAIWLNASPSPLKSSSAGNVGNAGKVVMISGRDDHGLLQEPTVSLFRAPDDNTAVTHVADGSFARVVGERGEWMKVQLLGKSDSLGWVNDFYLRSRMLRTDGGGQVDLVDAHEIGGQIWIGVRPVGKPESALMWLSPEVLQEIGAHVHK